jgi:hypothetical protein
MALARDRAGTGLPAGGRVTALLPSYLAPIHNPYWDEVKGHVTAGEFPWEGPCISRFDLKTGGFNDDYLDRHAYVRRYAWSVPDPWAVRFVACYARGALIDPMAGTGYWAYVLRQLGVDVACYDSSPPIPWGGNNNWHHDTPTWVPVNQGFAEVAIDRHPDRVLFLSWPPYSESSAYRTLREFAGDRFIYIGEGPGGCTGDDEFHELLDAEWHQIDARPLIQWWGLHDAITVYERDV